MSRIPLATVGGLLGFAAYVAGVLALADVLTPARPFPLFWVGQALFFVAAGTLWVFPARRLLFWAARKPLPPRSPRRRPSRN